MTIANVKRRASYTFSAGASYPFSFVVFDTDEVTVTVADASGAETVLNSSLYTVTLNSNGGTVVLDDSVSCSKVVITSAVPMTQESIITNKGGFYPDVLNKAHDKLTALVQQLDEKIDRAIKVPVSSTKTADSYKSEIEAIANEAKESAASAATSASTASTTASTALSTASQAVSTANQANTTASNANATANNANTTAQSALTSASTASTVANTANSVATVAQTTANDAQAKASSSLALATGASNSVNYIQAHLAEDIETEVSRQIGEELEDTVETIVRQVAPSIVEETVGTDYAKTVALTAETTARTNADTALGQRIDGLATVASSGSYSDLSNKPTIPTNVSALTNDANYTNKTYVDNAVASVDALPAQSGQSGKYLSTNGSTASWETVDALPSQSGKYGKFLKTNGTTATWDEIPASGLPIGAELIFYGATAPDGYLICNGAEVSRTAYPELFQAIGTLHGEGDGSTTFNLPDRINYPYAKGVESADVGEKLEAGLPNIVGEYITTATNGPFANSAMSGTGAFNTIVRQTTQAYAGTSSSATRTSGFSFDASLSNDIYSDDVDTVQPPSTGVLPCIKAFDSAVNQGTVDVTALANSVNTLASKPHVVEMSENSAGWWKVYSNGWVEQGGFIDALAVAKTTVLLPLEMRDEDYNILITNKLNASATKNAPHIMTVSTVNFVYWSENTNGDIYWKAEGWKAS